jgi:ATP-binding cassette, subfamily B, bacterial PglK
VLFRNLLRLLSDERPRLGWWIVLVVLSVGFAILELTGSLAILVLLRLFLEGDVSGLEVAGLTLGPPAGMSLDTLQVTLAVGLVGLFAARAGLMVATAYLGARLSTMASVRISRRLLAGYLHLPYVEHTQRRSSEMVRDTFVSTERLHEQVTRPLTMLVTDAIVSLGLVAALLIVDTRATALAAAFLITAMLTVQRAVRPRLRRWGGRAQEATSASLEILQQALAGIRDIRLLGQESRFLEHHDRERRRLAKFRYLSLAGQSIPRSTVELATITAIVLLLMLFGGSRTGSQQLLPVLGTFAYVGLRLQPILNRFIRHVNEIRANQVLIEQLLGERDRLAERPLLLRGFAASAVRPPDDKVPPQDIVFTDVSFAYPARNDEAPARVLEGVDLTIPAGAFVGIVGPTGGGKSTLLDLLVGLLEPTSGTITVGGVELGSAPRWWWEQLGVVSQAVYLTPGTIRENVAFSHPSPQDPSVEQRIWESLALAQLTETVRALPQGLDTPVGEAGIRLSGGQRQRVALARAVFRDPPVIVLDEGTSALDEETEAQVMTALLTQHRRTTCARTLIVVTHRRSTVADADRRIEIIDGRIRT